MAHSSLQQAKRIATQGQSFRICADANVFPPLDVANAFFACGIDDRRDNEQDVLKWEPFVLTDDEYRALLEWWQIAHPGARVDSLGLPDADFSRWFSAAAGKTS